MYKLDAKCPASGWSLQHLASISIFLALPQAVQALDKYVTNMAFCIAACTCKGVLVVLQQFD